MKLYHCLPQPLLREFKNRYEARKRDVRFRNAERLLISEARRLSAGCLEGIDSLSQWQAQTNRLREDLAWMLGLSPLPQRTDLCAEITGLVEKENYTIKKLVFQSLPGLYVTANFYLPKGSAAPSPCVLYLNGHWPSLDGAKTGYQDRYLWYPTNGFALLVVDPLQFGEVPGVHHGTSRLNLWDWLSLGYTPAGVEVWNAMRALDWLETRHEVDASRAAVTGISGGGVMTQFLAALDERVTVAAASCSSYTIGSQVALGLVPEQCDCTFYPNRFMMDFPVVAALIAPRPLIIFGGRKDPIFPPAGFREAFLRAKKIYDLHSSAASEQARIRLVESDKGHTDTDLFLGECRRWVALWLNEVGRLPVDAFAAPHPGTEAPGTLKCTTQMPALAMNFHVHEVWNEPRKIRMPSGTASWEERRCELLSILNETVFGWFPRQEIAFRPKRLRSSGGYAGDLAEFEEYELESEPGARLRIQFFRPKAGAPSSRTVVWIRRPEDNVRFPDLDEVLPFLASTIIVAVTPRFADGPLPGDIRARVERTAALTGRTIAAMQVWDVMRAVSWVHSLPAGNDGTVIVFGRGEAGITGLYAALLDERVRHVILRDPPISHRQGPALLTILRHTDIPETAALLAPRHLTVLSVMPPALEWTRQVFQLLGAGTRFCVKSSLAEAILGSDSARVQVSEQDM